MALFLDELEVILDQSKRVRDGAYEVLRQFIDDADNVPSLLLLCSLTEQLTTDTNRGIPSYPALHQRIGGMIKGGFSETDYRSITVNLNRLPLNTDELFELAKRIRHVLEVAMDWQASGRVTDEILKVLVEQAQQQTEVPTLLFLVQVIVTLKKTKLLRTADQQKASIL